MNIGSCDRALVYFLSAGQHGQNRLLWRSSWSWDTQQGLVDDVHIGISWGGAIERRGPMKILDHRLAADAGEATIVFLPSPHHYGVIVPEYLVMHYTASQNAYGSVAWFLNPKSKASAHLVIGRDGKICQCVPFNVSAWACGKSIWDGRPHCNSFTISIELSNAGKLVYQRGRWVTASFFDLVPQAEVRILDLASGSAWHKYTPEQIDMAQVVGRLLRVHYNLKGVVGHSDISPGRKIDPGPLFPIDDFRKAVMT